MRAVVVGVVVALGVAAGSGSVVGAAVGLHRAAGPTALNAGLPSWSPDGKQVVFSYLGFRRNRIVRTSSRPGGAIRTVHAGPSYFPVFWAPGGRIEFSDGYVTMYSVGMHGGKPDPIAFPSCGSGPRASCHPDSCLTCSPGNFAILTPNLEYAAVTTDSGAGNPPPPESIALLKLAPGHPPVEIQTALNAEEQTLPVSDFVVSFSPHGKQLIFDRAQDDGSRSLMALRLSGGAPVPLAQSGLPGASLVPADAVRVQWSPNGRWIAFYENGRLEVVSTTRPGAPRTVGRCTSITYFLSSFSWSPTSTLIAFDCRDNASLSGAALTTVRPDGTHHTNPLKNHRLRYVDSNAFVGAVEPAEWSPDGSRLLFLAHRVGHHTTHVWTVRPNGSHLARLG